MSFGNTRQSHIGQWSGLGEATYSNWCHMHETGNSLTPIQWQCHCGSIGGQNTSPGHTSFLANQSASGHHHQYFISVFTCHPWFNLKECLNNGQKVCQILAQWPCLSCLDIFLMLRPINQSELWQTFPQQFPYPDKGRSQGQYGHPPSKYPRLLYSTIILDLADWPVALVWCRGCWPCQCQCRQQCQPSKSSWIFVNVLFISEFHVSHPAQLNMFIGYVHMPRKTNSMKKLFSLLMRCNGLSTTSSVRPETGKKGLYWPLPLGERPMCSVWRSSYATTN